MFSYQMWAAEDPACQPACASGGDEAAGALSQAFDALPSDEMLSSQSVEGLA